MKHVARFVAALALVIACAVVVLPAQQPQPQGQGEWVAVNSLPQQEQIPAPPLLIGAYSFVMLVFFGYVISVARRLQSVEKEIERLERDIKKPARG